MSFSTALILVLVAICIPAFARLSFIVFFLLGACLGWLAGNALRFKFSLLLPALAMVAL